jgi:hypothetical protein
MTHRSGDDWKLAKAAVETQSSFLDTMVPAIDTRQIARDAYQCGYVDGMRAQRKLAYSAVETRTAPQRIQPRAADDRVPDIHVRCRFCDSGLLPGEVFDKPRECCEQGRKADEVTNHYSAANRRVE